MEEWNSDILINLLETLIDYRGKTPKKTSSGVPLVTAKIIKGGRILPFEEFIAEDDYNSWMVRGLPQPGDIVLTTEAPLGEVAQLDNTKVALAQRVVTLRGKKGILDNTFLKYFLQSDIGQKRLTARETGTTVTGIKQSELRKVEISYPDFDTQCRIASILKSLDDKIALNNRINHNLEEQAQALYKSWFIDFEPFKDGKFVDSEFGAIPEGWAVGSIYDLADIYYGAPFNSNLFNTEKRGLPLIRIRDLAKQEAGVFTEEKHIKGRLTSKGDILVGMDGEFSIYIWGGDESWINQRISLFIPNNRIGHYFLTESLRPLLKAVEASEVATTVIHIGKNDYDKFRVILPPQAVLDTFYTLTEPLFWQYVDNLSSARVLANTRDSLLPRLMSGDLKSIDLTC